MPIAKHKIDILISDKEIATRVQELGKDISQFYASINEPLIVVGVLKGSVIFLSDICRNLDIPVEMEFIGVSSYGNATKSSGVVQITQDLTTPVVNRHVLLVEDIIDTGLTARYLIDNITSRKPASIKFCSLLEKPEKNQGKITIDFLGFSIADEFVVGYGLDYAGLYRNLPYVGVLQL